MDKKVPNRALEYHFWKTLRKIYLNIQVKSLDITYYTSFAISHTVHNQSIHCIKIFPYKRQGFDRTYRYIIEYVQMNYPITCDCVYLLCRM